MNDYEKAAKQKIKRQLEQIQNPLESVEQTNLFEWADIRANSLPELRLMYAIPNGGSRNKIEAVNLKKQGVKAGVPDICLPVARQGYHGLYIEMKRRKKGRLEPEQKEWIELLIAQVYKVEVCKGFDEARVVIEGYMKV